VPARTVIAHLNEREGQMPRFVGVVIASFNLPAIAANIIFAAMIVAFLILVSSTALFLFYLLAAVQRILRSKR